ncbi:MAG: SGNH/GDSL hydrolase family protein [Myxococcota bacterium]
MGRHLGGHAEGAIVALGDSITDGLNTTPNANNRWPDVLSRRLLGNAGEDGQQTGVLNVGISGNRILNDSQLGGVAALSRLDRDVFMQAGVTHVVLLEGINDIGLPNTMFDPEFPDQDVSASQIIMGMEQIIEQAHDMDLQIFGATLLPYEGAIYFTEDGEAKRQEVNTWIRDSGAFDGIIDFDLTIRDPDNPRSMRPEFDSGDRLHPSDSGMDAMGEAVDLRLLDN